MKVELIRNFKLSELVTFCVNYPVFFLHKNNDATGDNNCVANSKHKKNPDMLLTVKLEFTKQNTSDYLRASLECYKFSVPVFGTYHLSEPGSFETPTQLFPFALLDVQALLNFL